MDIVKRMRRRNDRRLGPEELAPTGHKARIVPAAGRGVDVRMPSVQVRALATVRGASLVEEAEIKRLRASGGCLGTERR